MLIKEKQGLSVITAVLMLLILVVVLVGSFGNWFNFFTTDVSSDLSGDVENKLNEGEISTIIGGDLYIYNKLPRNLTVQEVKINGRNCEIESNSLISGTDTINISSCLESETQTSIEVSIVTNEGILSKSIPYTPLEICSNETAEGFAGGDGSSGTPFEICNCEQLQNVNNYLTDSFILTSNVDCSDTSSWNSGEGFEPISIFQGVFNGSGYSISNIYINRPSESYVGLFGNAYAVTIKNFTLENVEITGNFMVGGVVGYLERSRSSLGSLESVSTSGIITGDSNVGGIVGYIDNSFLFYTMSSAEIYGDDNIGGIVGHIDGHIYDSYFVGTINSSGGSNIGGIVGQGGFSASIINSYSTATIHGNSLSKGGLGGEMSFGIIENSFSSPVISNVTSAGSILGTELSVDSTVINNTYWNNNSLNPAESIYDGGDRIPPEITIIQDNISYFYDNTNPPFNNTWNTSIWDFSGSSLPTLK